MRQSYSAAVIDPRQLARRGLRDVGLGFLYWLGFVLILEPGNLLRWSPPNAAAWAHEGLRLIGAGLLGGVATPAILALTRRLPIEGPNVWRRGVAHLLFCAGMTVVMIVASCVLAELLPNAPHQALLHSVVEELAANGSLVAAWIAGLTALAHAVRAARGGAQADRPASRLAIRQRGRFERLELAEVDWIETQGNYLALHGSAGTRLVRQTAKTFEAGLDPRRFVRIHRRSIVALDAVQTMTPLAAGDAEVRLKSGQTLRVSRSCRVRLRTALEEPEASA
jgi:LytTr DNA-binding domain